MYITDSMPTLQILPGLHVTNRNGHWNVGLLCDLSAELTPICTSFCKFCDNWQCNWSI